MPSKTNDLPGPAVWEGRRDRAQSNDIPVHGVKGDRLLCSAMLLFKSGARCFVAEGPAVQRHDLGLQTSWSSYKKKGIPHAARTQGSTLERIGEVQDDVVVVDEKKADEIVELGMPENLLSLLDLVDSLVFPEGLDHEAKCKWLRSQIIGNSLEFLSPFGGRLITYADHTASGRALVCVENGIFNNLLPVYGNSHTEDSYVGRTTTHLVNEAARYVKRRMGGKPDDILLFCGSGSTAAIKRLQDVIAISAPSVLLDTMRNSLRKQNRWVVFIGPYEHHSNILSWRNSLAEVVQIPLSSEGLVDINILQKELQNPKYAGQPKLGSFSAASNVTGLLTDTRTIARILHTYQAFACFDFAGCGPYVEIDMRSGEMDGYDAVFLSPHKFMGGPGTSGLLLMHKQLYRLGSNAPSTAGGGAVDYVNGWDEKNTVYTNNIEQREDAGTPPIIQKVKTALVFLVKELIGTDLIMERESYFIKNAISRLQRHEKVIILGNTVADRIAILSFNIYSSAFQPQHSRENLSRRPGNMRRRKLLHHRFVVTLLNDLFGIQARSGCSCAAPYGHALLSGLNRESLAIRELVTKGSFGVKPGWARVSFGYYITSEEYENILAAIEFIADRGHQFLSFYNFDWNTGNWTFRESTKARNHELTPVKNRCDADRNAAFQKYLDIARQIADCVPDNPAQRPVPDNIEPRLISFAI